MKYGNLCNYSTGEAVRAATRENWLRSRAEGDRHTGAHRDAASGELVYCDGPDADPEVTDEQVKAGLGRFAYNEAVARRLLCPSELTGFRTSEGDGSSPRAPGLYRYDAVRQAWGLRLVMGGPLGPGLRASRDGGASC